jgi:hypothetical protein
MLKKPKEKIEYTTVILLIVFGIVVGALWEHYRNKETNPRKLNGKHTMETADSIYHLSFKIDSVEAVYYDPGDKPTNR